MLNKFYIAKPMFKINTAGSNGCYPFPILMAERHREKFLDYIDDLISTDTPDSFDINAGVNMAGTTYILKNIQDALIKAESNEFFIGSCLRLGIGYNENIGLVPGSPVLLLKPLLDNMKNEYSSYNHIINGCMKRIEYLTNISYKYDPSFFKFDKEDITTLLLIREIGKEKP